MSLELSAMISQRGFIWDPGRSQGGHPLRLLSDSILFPTPGDPKVSKSCGPVWGTLIGASKMLQGTHER